MTRLGKRWLGALLALCMVVGMLPAASAAGEGTGTVAKGTYTDENGVTQSYEVSFDTPLPAEGGTLAPGNYYLAEDVTMPAKTELTITSGTVRIDLAGHVLAVNGGDYAYSVRIADGGTLEFYDSSVNAENASPAVHHCVKNDSGKWVLDDANQSGDELLGGCIVNAETAYGIRAESGGAFWMFAGNIIGTGVISSQDGTCTLAGGTFKGTSLTGQHIAILGGQITGCSSAVGGSGIMTGGSIHDNTTGLTPISFTIAGGEICNNSYGAKMDYTDTLTMTGGEIRDNSSAGVYLEDDASFDMTGGVISGCEYGVNMGNNARFTMDGGEIKASKRDGVIVYTSTSDQAGKEVQITVNGGKIHSNSRGGVSLLRGKFTMTGGEIYENNGRGVEMLQNTTALTLTGGVIRDNHPAGYDVAGLYCTDQALLDIQFSGAPTIVNNVNAKGNQGNLFLNWYQESGVGKVHIINIAGPLTYTEKMGMSMEIPSVFTKGWSVHMGDADPADYFVSERDGYAVRAKAMDDGTVEAELAPTHTATFKADEAVVDTVTFFQGDATLTEPEVPAKAHYDGVWEEYDLAAATADITVNAVYTQNNDHSATETAVVTAPTCTEAGYTTYTCSVCGDARQADEVAALGHDYQKDEAQSVPAAPGVEGYDLYVCSRDPSHTKREPIPALPRTFTATFVADGVTVATVEFTEGDATLSEPEVPAKTNYNGAWEEYDLAAATADITVNAVYTPILTGTVAKGSYIDENGDTQSYEVHFDIPLPTAGGTLAPGNYYLPEDITLPKTLSVRNGTVKLDLAGHILRCAPTSGGSVYVVDVVNGGALEVYDSDANADNPTKTVHPYTKETTASTQAWVFEDGGSDGSISGGVIAANGWNTSSAGHQNTQFCISGGTASIYGGTICNSDVGVSGPTTIYGGDITGNWMGIDSSDSFKMYGGFVRNNNTDGVSGTGSFDLYGGVISGNARGIAPNAGGTVTMHGGRITENYYGVKLSSVGTFNMYDGSITANRSSGVALKSGYGEGQNNHFTMYDGTISGNEGAGVEVDGSTPLSKATFEMKGGTIQNNSKAGVDVNYYGVFSMDNGDISGNNAGGVRVAGSSFTLNGGRIHDNSALNGGGVYFTGATSNQNDNGYPDGEMIMRGGEITNNRAISANGSGGEGGGVIVGLYNGTPAKATFTMSGGKISGNTADSGGGIYIGEAGHLVLSDAAEITENYAANSSRNDVELDTETESGKAEPIVIAGPITSTKKPSVYMKTPSVFTSGWSTHMAGTDPADHFVSAVEGYQVRTQTVDGAIEAALVKNTHIATFAADGVTVATVDFTEGDAALTEPEVPAKAHYDGVWEEYDLSAATADITVNAVYTQNDDHSATETAAVTAPTCETVGYTTYTCSVCGNARQADEVDALGHDYQKDEAQSVPATPGVAGYDLYVCSRDPSHTKRETIPALPRTFTATFVADGVTVAAVDFTEGDAALTEPEVPAKAHYDGVWEEYDLSAATADITVNAVYTQNDDHSATETAAVTAPTCETAGYTTYTCSVCGNARQADEVDALGHDYQKDEAQSVPAAPGVAGYDLYVCSRDPSHVYKVPVALPIITHTATFMIGDEVIDTVVFEEGSVTLAEPAMPPRPNYVGQWESYDLAAARGDITVQGRYTPVDPDKVSDVDGKAEAKYENGVVNIDLTARAASKTIKVTSETTKPVDVVLVLDQSGSMADSLSARDRQSKRDALVNCASAFVRQLYQNAADTGADHRVAVVGFAYSAYNRSNYKNTGLLATPSGRSVGYGSLKHSDYASALLPINSAGDINANVVRGINSIVADGATAADLGLTMARNIFEANPTEGDRERVVVFITDGTPTAWGEDTELVSQTAAQAIAMANTIKNGQSAKIYSVGVHADADPAAAFTAAEDGVTTNRRGQFVSYDFNRFLHAVSSNYPGAQAMNDLGQGSRDGGFYMGVNDTGNLGGIFTNILYSTVYQLKTFDKATFTYTLAKEFDLTLEQELAMRAELKETQGLTDADIQVTRNEDGTTTLRFRNVKTKEAYDADGALCYEASVHFQVSANRAAQSGGALTTGGGDSGVGYEEGALTPIAPAVVTVPQARKLIVFTINGQVYRIQESDLGAVVTVPETELATWDVAEGTVVTGDYTVFEAQADQTRQFAIRWVIGREETIEWYPVGAAVTTPEVPAIAGYTFAGWSRSVPSTMPAYDLVCEAIYSPAHVHSYEKAGQTGNCRDGLVTIYRCACGEEKREQAQPGAHNFTAVLTENGSSGHTLERVVCTKCGQSEEQDISFKVSYSQGWRTTVLDLDLLRNEVNVVEPEEKIELRFYVGEDDGRLYTVTRIDSDGARTTYRTWARNGYLVFEADHFSVYVIEEQSGGAQGPEEQVSYEAAVDILDSKEDIVMPGEPEVTENAGEGGGSSGGHGGSPSGGSGTVGTPAPVKEQTASEMFDDVVAGSWYESGVTFAVKKALFQGVGDGRFAPGENMTRAMWMTVLARLDGQDTSGGETWYQKGLDWAVRGGISDGTAFEAEVTREQLVTMLYRYAKAAPAEGELADFADRDSVSVWALDAVKWAVEQGLLKGKDGGRLDPQGTATRAEVATILQRFCTDAF